MNTILFNTEMAKAILDGRKTQFKKVIKEDFYYKLDEKTTELPYVEAYTNRFIRENSKYQIGDILYVQEPYYKLGCWAFSQMCDSEDHESTGENCFNTVAYKDDIDSYDLAYPVFEYDLESAETMGEEDARIFLKVTNVRVERLQNILVQDIIREGYYNPDCTNHSNPHYFAEMAKKWWINLWNSTAKDGYKWKDNPFVFVYEFERINYERFS